MEERKLNGRIEIGIEIEIERKCLEQQSRARKCDRGMIEIERSMSSCAR